MEPIKEEQKVEFKPKMDVKQIYNPWSKPFTFTWERDEYTIPAKGIASFPEFLVNHARKYMIDKAIKDEAYKIMKSDVPNAQDKGERLIQARTQPPTREKYFKMFDPPVEEEPVKNVVKKKRKVKK